MTGAELRATVERNEKLLAKLRATNKWMQHQLDTVKLPVRFDKEKGDAPEVEWFTRRGPDAMDYYKRKDWRREHLTEKLHVGKPIKACPWCYKHAMTRHYRQRDRARVWNALGGKCALCQRYTGTYTRARFVRLFGGRSEIRGIKGPKKALWGRKLHSKPDLTEVKRDYVILCLACYRNGGREKLWRRGVERHLPMDPLFKQGRKPKVIRPQDVKDEMRPEMRALVTRLRRVYYGK